MTVNRKRRRQKEYYCECSTCGDLQDAYSRPEQAKYAIDRHQSKLTLDPKMPSRMERHRITVRLRKED
jgi:hypothetical protein